MNDAFKDIQRQADEIAARHESEQQNDYMKSTTGLGFSMVDLMEIEGKIGGEELPEEMYNVCMYCGGTGLGLKGETECPECGKKFEKPTLEGSEYPTNIKVPMRYKGNVWDKNKALACDRVQMLPTNLVKIHPIWVSLLEQLLLKAQDNLLFRDSYLISAPDGLGKHIWLYTIIRKLHKHNVYMSPVFVLNELDVYSDEITNYSVLFIDVLKFNLTQHVDKLDYILHKRKMLDLPTFVITSLPYEYLKTTIDQEPIYFDEIIKL